MRLDPAYGIEAPELGWVPAPRYLLRRSRVLKLLRDVPRGRILEVGCGAGALLYDLAKEGFRCTGYDTSEDAVAVARKIHEQTGVTIGSTSSATWEADFDGLLAFEVLEHVDDDLGTIRQWARWVKPGGWFLISVPAHSSMWGPLDEWAGHVRRYGRSDLRRLVEQAALAIVHLECYGFPLSRLMHPVRSRRYAALLARHKSLTPTVSRARQTASSGIRRTEVLGSLYRFHVNGPGKLIMRVFIGLQGLFLNTDWGDGYLLLARKN